MNSHCARAQVEIVEEHRRVVVDALHRVEVQDEASAAHASHIARWVFQVGPTTGSHRFSMYFYYCFDIYSSFTR